MQYDKKQREQEKTQYHLRRQRESKEQSLTGYEPSEREEQEKNIPRERLLAESEDGFLSAGFCGEKQEKVVLLVTQDREDRVLREEKQLKREGARPERIQGKQVLTNSRDPKKSAALFELDSAKNKKRLLTEISAMMEKTGNETVSDLLPYLDEKEQKEQIKALEDEARENSRDPVLAVRSRKTAGRIREELQEKEAEKQRLLKMLETSLNQEQEKETNRHFPWELLLGEAAALLPDEDTSEGDAESSPAEPQNPPNKAGSPAPKQEPAKEHSEEPTSLFEA